ncbi:restriction endonuclease subunit S [Streptococcus mitis]|nr:restriction endonuclease subunit S [Streptococcus mitis]
MPWSTKAMLNIRTKNSSLKCKSRFNEMFGDPVLNDMGWERCRLKDISVEKLAYGSGASAIEFSGLRYIRITDIDTCGNLKPEKKSPSQFDEKYLLNTGDILFARSGATVGKTFLYSKKKHGPALYAGYLIRLIPNHSLVNPIFVYHFTKTKYYNDFIAKVQNAVAQPNINAKQYSELDFILPPLSLQNEFADFVAQVDKSQFACGIVIKLWRNSLKSSII